MPTETPSASRASYVTSTVHNDATVAADRWASLAVQSICASTRKTGNHVCRPDVCYKGSIGRKGFCRMMYWHWTRGVDKKGNECARRCHGVDLHQRWNGSSASETSSAQNNDAVKSAPVVKGAGKGGGGVERIGAGGVVGAPSTSPASYSRSSDDDTFESVDAVVLLWFFVARGS